MENQNQSPHFHFDAFLFLLIIFTVTGVLSCLYHWDKRRSRPDDLEAFPPSYEPLPLPPVLKTNRRQSLPVVMPGDRIPKFIAMPCPREPPRVAVRLPEPPFPVPLY